MHRTGNTEARANLRSATPRGFARAVFEANHRSPTERVKDIEHHNN